MLPLDLNILVRVMPLFWFVGVAIPMANLATAAL
jgi:hypothetical protein